MISSTNDGRSGRVVSPATLQFEADPVRQRLSLSLESFRDYEGVALPLRRKVEHRLPACLPGLERIGNLCELNYNPHHAGP